MIKVIVSSLFRKALNSDEVEVKANRISVRNLVAKLGKMTADRDGFSDKIFNEDGNLRTGTTIFINGRRLFEIDLLGSVVNMGDEVGLFRPKNDG